MNRTRIVVADPTRIFRAGVRNLLERESEFEVLEAGTLGDLLATVERERADIALVDLDLPPQGGIAAVRRLVRCCPASIVVWSFEPSGETVLEAVRAGADGFLRKETSAQALVRALRGVVQGKAALPRRLTSLMIDALHGLDERARARAQAAALSPREREVLDLVARGAHNRQIAGALMISEFTVKRHVQNILHKLELPSRHAAASLYQAAGGAEEAPLAVSRIG